MSAHRERHGGCLCGAIRFRATGAPHSAGYCHCRMCQRATGAPVTAWATYPAEQFEVTQGAIAEFASSAKARRGHCAACGTSLTFRYTTGGRAFVDVTIASFEEPSALVPQYHIWTASGMPWLAIDDALPRHADGGPDLQPE